MTSSFDAPTAVERELVLRLASLLWRLRRATAIETGLLQLQSDIVAELRRPHEAPVGSGPDRFQRSTQLEQSSHDIRACERKIRAVSPLGYVGRSNPDAPMKHRARPNSEIARCFLRLANLDNGVFERANRYETALWRQVGQVLLTLDFLRRTG